MYPAPFEYYQANSVDEAVQLLKQHEGAKLLAGGHSLLPLMNLRLAQPPALVDIGRIAELRGVTLDGNVLRVGALTTYAKLAHDPLVLQHCPVLAETATHVGDTQVRNRGTIGGSLAHADPASDMPTVTVALGAEFGVKGGLLPRMIKAEDMFEGLMATALKNNEILTEIRVPVLDKGTGGAYAKFRNPASGYAIVGVAAVLHMEGPVCKKASVVIGGINPKPTRATSLEQALNGKTLDDAVISAAADLAAKELDDASGDIHASAEYRKAMAAVYAKRAIHSAMQRARG